MPPPQPRTLALPFPALVADVDAIDSALAHEQDRFTEALHRLSGLVQYELTASWAEEQQVDLAAPVKGAEYLKRRQRAEVRVSAIDNKLRTVTAGMVQDGPSEGVRLRLSGPWPPNDFV